MIYVDIDGVLRDLCGAAGINPIEWDCKIGSEKKSFTHFFSDNLNLLVTAKTTEYFPTILFHHTTKEKITLLSAQLKMWREYTEVWLKTHFINFVPETIFTSNKLKYLTNKEDILIEDSPNLSDYTQVILIDRPYNRNIKLPHKRVKTPWQLVKEIDRRKYGI